MLIFFDTEFTDLGVNPRLISIGLVAEDGERAFYAELSDTYAPEDCGDFAREVVLPLLDDGDAHMTFPALSLRLGNWIEGFEQPITLATDSLAWDWPWIQKLFEEPGTWPANLDGQPLLLTMNYLVDYDQFEAAIESAFSGGLRRHHALDDAKANRLGWIAAGGDTEHHRPRYRLVAGSMKIALYSDLHLETGTWEPPALDVDAVILAGDIGSHTRGMSWASNAFCRDGASPPILYVAGNHEYYDAHLGLLNEMQKPVWAHSGVSFLERRCVELSGVRFLGCTLWSGFDLHGADKAEAYMDVARRGINDYWMILARGGKRLEPRDTLKLHRTAVRWLDAELAKPFAGKTVVVTHFAPHRQCVARQHEGSDVSPYFVTDLSWLMEKHRIALWCYGHTHTNNDFVAEGGCRVVSNQLGYPGERTRTEFGMQIDTGFRNNLVIEL